MEGSSRKKEGCPQLLDLIHKDREWLVNSGEEESFLGVREEKKLELRLGPPGEDDESSSLSYKYYTLLTHNNNTFINQTPKLGSMFSTAWGSNPNPSVYQTTSPSCTKGVGELQQSQAAEKKACSSQPSAAAAAATAAAAAAATAAATVPANTAINNSSQKRCAPSAVVGWPPVRSFRKNLANSSSSKQVQDSHNGGSPKEVNKKQESCSKGMFVKINMDGVPIGRKVDLKAYDSYEKLSCAVDELFRGLLAAQRDSPVTGNLNKIKDVKEIKGLLEYTLVYEDHEGDRMLVGDVPWDMFTSTVKRLRVLKSSELSALRVGSGKQGKTPE